MKTKSILLYNYIIGLFKPITKITVSEWADQNRVVSAENSAEPGKWNNERTPYMIPIMDAFTESDVREIYVIAGAQVGKSEFLNNCFGYIVSYDPGGILWIQPTVETSEDYSKERLSNVINDTPVLKALIAEHKGRDKNNTILKKMFPGGFLAMVGSNSPSGLRSRPVRYVLGDEWDAWAKSAGTEGDPAKLAIKRTTTFFNRKVVIVSTPTIKGASSIEDAYLSGTMEKWSIKCPNCNKYHFIEHKDIEYKKEVVKNGHIKNYNVWDIFWICPNCKTTFTEQEIKRQPGKMISENPKALDNGIRSFRLNSFISPWMSWKEIITEFLNAQDDPLKLQVVINTLFGETFEDRGETETEGELMSRREKYGCEVPNGVLVLTCGVDTQDNRLEYEIVGHGTDDETWGIKYGIIPGDPKDEYVWLELDKVIDRVYHYKNGKGIKVAAVFVDSGGHRTTEVYEQCRKRLGKLVFAIKGKGGSDIPFVGVPKIISYNSGRKKRKCWLYVLGVDSGKSIIMNNLRVKKAGARYCHFPIESSKGYNNDYFDGLLSERLVRKRSKGKYTWGWEVIKGRGRNEPLDLRNYALAAKEILNFDFKNTGKNDNVSLEKTTSKKRSKRSGLSFDEW